MFGVAQVSVRLRLVLRTQPRSGVAEANKNKPAGRGTRRRAR
jgi:hypothetical protein